MKWFPLSLSVALGLFAGAYVNASVACLAASLMTALSLALRRSAGKWMVRYGLICILAALYFQGYDALHRSSLRPLGEAESEVWLRGTIDSAVKRDGDVVRFFVLVEAIGVGRNPAASLPRPERIALRLRLTEEAQTHELQRWAEGQPLAGKVRLSLPDRARNPYAFDYARYLRWQGVTVTGEAAYTSVAVQTDETGLTARFQLWQNDAAGTLDTLFPDPLTAGYMKALLFGLQEAVSPELEEVYADLGLIHVLAISGLHVSLVSIFFLRLAERIGMGRTAPVIAVLLIGLYVLLVGASASAVRAGVMGAIAVSAQALRKRVDVREIWAVALLIMLLFNPYQLWHVGFQLSFVVTLGLILYVPMVQQLVLLRWKWLRSLVAVTVSAQLVSFPLLIYHFHQFSPVSWLVNLVAVPILSLLVLPAGYVAFLFGLLHPALALLPAAFATLTLQWVHQPLAMLQQVPLPFSHWAHPHPTWVIAYGLLLAAVPILWRLGYQRRRDVLAYVFLFLLLIAWARQPFSGNGEVRITFLDVGQGDSIVVEVGKEKVYLIDTGGTLRFSATQQWRERRAPFEVGRDVVLPFLRARGIERIDRVVLTHADYDHIGGLAALVPRFFFGAVLINGRRPEGKEAELIRAFQERGVPVVTGAPGQSWHDTPDVRWTWLHPRTRASQTDNDASIVLALTAYGTTVLFTGDMEREAEEQLLRTGLLPSVDVLKVAHHGSATSSSPAFLAAIQPKAAVVSVGRHNRYGHPSPVVLKRLKDAGAAIYRTDVHGGVTLVIRPQGVFWTTGLSDT